VLPVDVATTPDGAKTVIAGAAPWIAGVSFVPANVTEVVIPPPPTVPPDAGPDARPIVRPPENPCAGFVGHPSSYVPTGEGVIGVGFGAKGELLALTREPALWVNDRKVRLPGDRIEDTGHELFHAATTADIACASCHPEGREDGHVWSFSTLGPRRTQSIGGGILGTEPFHWNGEMRDFPMLSHEVFNNRMSGPSLRPEHVRALANWIDAIPPWKKAAPSDGLAAERGRVLFNDPAVGCSSCHAGARLTNNATVNVGTAAIFQVPSLRGVSYRAPFMHGGCASTLLDRFSAPCGGTNDRHGMTSSLSQSQRADLVAYLETL
jgi:mono/diheme cytochrome c family protein